MNKSFWIALGAIAFVIILAVLLSPTSGGDAGLFLMILGAISLLAGALLGLIAFVMRLANNSWPKPVLIASAICIVIGGGVCGSLFVQM